MVKPVGNSKCAKINQFDTRNKITITTTKIKDENEQKHGWRRILTVILGRKLPV